MFKNLADFGFNRSTSQAVGFYFAYLLLLMLLAGLSAGILLSSDAMTAEEGFQEGTVIGTKLAPIAVLVVAGLVLRGKNLYRDYKYILLTVLAGLVSILGGAILGLIPVAYMTTRPKMK